MRAFNLRVDTALVMTSSMGNLLKWIIVKNGKTIYVKSSTYTNVNFKHEWMYESYSEVFDNGNSLFALKHIEEFKYSKGLERHLICKPFCNKHSAQLRMIGTKPKINSNIENTLKYIKNLERQGLNKQRVNFIQDMLSSRVQELI